jgi:pentapeptide MXKDX repeat protein
MNACRTIFAAMLMAGVTSAASAQDAMTAPKNTMAAPKDTMTKSGSPPNDSMAMAAKPMKHDSMKKGTMKHDSMMGGMKHDSMKQDSMTAPH